MNKKRLALITLQSLSIAAIVANSSVSAGGYKIPESSLNGTALSAAYIASTHGADSSYYNPANMSFNENKMEAEISASYIKLSKVNYVDNTTSLQNANSLGEEFLVPTMHFTSENYDGIHIGLSMVSPGGLSKRWDDAYPKATAEEFTLQTLEINPTASYQINSQLSLGGGLRFIHAEGIVKSSVTTAGGVVSRDMKGNTNAYGYNLALSYKPTSNSSFGLTYRSEVDLDIKGTAKLNYLSSFVPGSDSYDGAASVSVPLPASLNVAFAFDILSGTTLELVYEKTYWSAYKDLDFNYNYQLGGGMGTAFDDPKAKDWRDTNTYRIGLSHQFNKSTTIMLGYAKDESPVPTSTLGFELPSNDGDIYSVGLEYKLDNEQSVGIAYLYTEREEVSVNNGSINGTFSNSNVSMLTMAYKRVF